LTKTTPRSVSKHIFTDEDLYDQAACKELEIFATYMTACCEFNNGHYDLVLEVHDDDKGREGHKTWCYYFVNHTTKSIFWLEEYNASRMIAEVRGITLADDKSCLSELCLAFVQSAGDYIQQNILWNQSIGRALPLDT